MFPTLILTTGFSCALRVNLALLRDALFTHYHNNDFPQSIADILIVRWVLQQPFVKFISGALMLVEKKGAM